jgi:hypothetical protein
MTTESDTELAARWRRKARAMPAAREEIPYRRCFSAAERAQLERGVTPREMQDKWTIFLEGDRLRLVRSWTGYCIFEALLAARDDRGAQVAGAWASRDGEQYGGTDPAYDAALLTFLVDNLVLGLRRPFPLPAGEAPSPVPGRGLLQHHLTGTGYPEVALADFEALLAGEADR